MKRKLALGITIALVSALSISIGATAIRNTKDPHTKIYMRSDMEAASRVYPPGVIKQVYRTATVIYKGELIPLVQLPEVTISGTPIVKR